LIAADESTIVTEPFLDAAVVEYSEGNWSEVFCEADDALDKLFTPEALPGRLGR
jgi:hypothetical protein